MNAIIDTVTGSPRFQTVDQDGDKDRVVLTQDRSHLRAVTVYIDADEDPAQFVAALCEGFNRLNTKETSQ